MVLYKESTRAHTCTSPSVNCGALTLLPKPRCHESRLHMYLTLCTLFSMHSKAARERCKRCNRVTNLSAAPLYGHFSRGEFEVNIMLFRLESKGHILNVTFCDCSSPSAHHRLGLGFMSDCVLRLVCSSGIYCSANLIHCAMMHKGHNILSITNGNNRVIKMNVGHFRPFKDNQEIL